MADPWQAITASQQRALRLVNDTFTGVVKMGRAGITQPEEAVARLTALVAAIGDLAASSTKPMEALLSNQRNIANTMATFAQLQRDMADVVEGLAHHHAAVLDAMEKLASPAIAVSDLIRRDPVVEKAQERAQAASESPPKSPPSKKS